MSDTLNILLIKRWAIYIVIIMLPLVVANHIVPAFNNIALKKVEINEADLNKTSNCFIEDEELKETDSFYLSKLDIPFKKLCFSCNKKEYLYLFPAPVINLLTPPPQQT